MTPKKMKVWLAVLALMLLSLGVGSAQAEPTAAESAGATQAIFDLIDDGLDSDSDGLPDDYEVLVLGTDPANPDSDGDTLNDGFEVANGLNPNSADSDGDNWTDDFELANGYNPINKDVDFDRILDGNEAEEVNGVVVSNCVYDPLNDDDLDGLCYADDNCPFVANADQLDTDNDLIGDACDSLVNSAEPDTDGDLVADGLDNCVDWPNVQQQDRNGDGIGNACQCGDLTGDGKISRKDIQAFETAQTATNLSLEQLERCDVSGDGVCTQADLDELIAFLPRGKKGVNRGVLTRAVCPTVAQVKNRALNKLGYGPSTWSRDRIDQLRALAPDGDTNPYAGVDDYIVEQLSPWNVPDSGYFQQELEYSVEASGYGMVAEFPTVGMSAGDTYRNYCVGVSNSFCAASQDSRWRQLGNSSEVKFLRATNSHRQLDAVLQDFWFNHFSIFGTNSWGGWTTGHHEKALADNMYVGYEHLVQAQTESVSMLDYLDLRANFAHELNENFARELMELHTVGISRDIDGDGVIGDNEKTYDGEYLVNGELVNRSGANINEVARVLTGYQYYASMGTGTNFLTFLIDGNNDHDKEGKAVLMGAAAPWTFDYATQIHAPTCGAPSTVGYQKGYEEGRTLICNLARHEMTADTVGTKLIRRFLGDTAVVVEGQLLADFKTDWANNAADLTSAMETLLLSDAFKRSLYYEDAKFKRSTVFTSSLIRALGPDSEGTSQIANQSYTPTRFANSFRGLMGDFQDAGEGVFLAPHPIGWPETSSGWTGAGLIINHLNQVIRLLNDDDPDRRADLAAIKTHMNLASSYSNSIILVRDVATAVGVALNTETVAAITAYVDKELVNDDLKVKRAILGVMSTPEFLSH